MSLGFHYYETVAQSLALQWLPKGEAAHGLGKIMAAGSFAALAAFGLIYLLWTVLGLEFRPCLFAVRPDDPDNHCRGLDVLSGVSATY